MSYFRDNFNIMLPEFLAYLKEVCGHTDDQKYLLTVSGGIDSVVMSDLFKSAGLKFAIAHCNFQLRNEESDGDQLFVEEIARGYEVPVHIMKFNTVSYAAEKGISIEMAARDLRYSWFEKLAMEQNYTYIATGHNKNDVVETVLLNLARGTGIRGLMGIRPVNKNILRPMLFATRAQITFYAEKHKLRWREDSSNQETTFHRNKVRHTIIPAFEQINPAFLQNALNTINRLEQTGKLLDLVLDEVKLKACRESADRMLIDIRKLKSFPAFELLLFELLKPFGIAQLNQDALIRSLDSFPGKQFHTNSHTISLDRGTLIIIPKTSNGKYEFTIEPDTVLVNYPVRLYFRFTESNNEFRIPRERNIAALDADKITYPLLLRNWNEGDRFYPLGLKGSKKVSDFLINIKLPLPDKKRIWIIESANKIAWIVNHRIDDRFKITNSTRKILIIDYQE